MGERTVEKLVEEEKTELRFYCDFCDRDEAMVDSDDEFISLVSSPQITGRSAEDRSQQVEFNVSPVINGTVDGSEYNAELRSQRLYHLCPECAEAFFVQFDEIDLTEELQ